ncbi:hypothetical protein AQUCO_02600086v1 [Aquilegia coerulea]|uniref:Uncharacterized protein n=1 Tax=Aquilegia coerulea TaxID=218851 RepID=A0A2G5D796_AQUCA|nr:hypothetical protein AQUCO_02600086v1 [Aquilegia coerulea]
MGNMVVVCISYLLIGIGIGLTFIHHQILSELACLPDAIHHRNKQFKNEDRICHCLAIGGPCIHGQG